MPDTVFEELVSQIRPEDMDSHRFQTLIALLEVVAEHALTMPQEINMHQTIKVMDYRTLTLHFKSGENGRRAIDKWRTALGISDAPSLPKIERDDHTLCIYQVRADHMLGFDVIELVNFTRVPK